MRLFLHFSLRHFLIVCSFSVSVQGTLHYPKLLQMLDVATLVTPRGLPDRNENSAMHPATRCRQREDARGSYIDHSSLDPPGGSSAGRPSNPTLAPPHQKLTRIAVHFREEWETPIGRPAGKTWLQRLAGRSLHPNEAAPPTGERPKRTPKSASAAFGSASARAAGLLRRFPASMPDIDRTTRPG